MDLALVMEQLKPGENVSPDMSSYNKMVAYWRGTGFPPTLQEVDAKWLQIEAEFVESQKQADIDQKLSESEANVNARLDALWEKIMDADSTKANALKVIVDQIKP